MGGHGGSCAPTRCRSTWTPSGAGLLLSAFTMRQLNSSGTLYRFAQEALHGHRCWTNLDHTISELLRHNHVQVTSDHSFFQVWEAPDIKNTDATAVELRTNYLASNYTTCHEAYGKICPSFRRPYGDWAIRQDLNSSTGGWHGNTWIPAGTTFMPSGRRRTRRNL